MKKILLTMTLAIIAFSMSFAEDQISNISCSPVASGWGASVDKGTQLTYTFDIDLGTDVIGDSVKITLREWSSSSDAAGTTKDNWFYATTSYKGQSKVSGATVMIDTKDLTPTKDLTDNKTYFVNIYVQKPDGSYYPSKCPGSINIMEKATGQVITGSWDLLGPDYLTAKDITHIFTAGDKINIDFYFDAGVYNDVNATLKSMKVVMRIVDSNTWAVRGGTPALLPNTDTEVLGIDISDSSRVTYTVPTLPTDLNENERYQLMIILTFSDGEDPTSFDWQGFSYDVGDASKTIEASLVSGNGSSTGLNKLTAENASIYVNNGILYINSKQAKQISIYSISGSVVKTINLTKGQNIINTLEKGFYIVGGNKILIK